VADLGFVAEIDDTEIKSRISFSHGSVMDFDIHPEMYQAIIAARLIQYLDPIEVSLLLDRIRVGLTQNGLAMLSYTASGGIFEQPDIDVPKYQHTIDQVINALEITGLEIVTISEGSKTSLNVPYQVPNETYDLVIRK
jgi:hypothetical protein